MAAPRGLFEGFTTVTALMTRLPVATVESADAGAVAGAAWAFPLVGAGIGALCALVFTAAEASGLGATPAAWLAVLGGVLLTGALHEDGLADMVDGFGGGGDRAAKLAIMRDSRHGTFGVLALVLSLGARAAALAGLGDSIHVGLALIAAHAASRAFLALAMWALPAARDDGLGAAAGRPGAGTAGLAVAIGAAIAVTALGPWRGIAALACAALAVAATAILAQRQIGGYTGDVLGAFQQIGEITMLLAAVAR